MVDKTDMDLSKLLGDVYDNDMPASGGRERRAEPPAPEWSDEAHLDKVFADWTPGPPAEAPAAEREILIDAPTGPARLDDDLAAALSAALVDAGGPANEPVVDLAVGPAGTNGGAPAIDLGMDDNLGRPPIDLGIELPVDDRHEPLHGMASPIELPVQPETGSFVANEEDHHLGLMEVPDPVPVIRSWQRSDDDILPGRSLVKVSKAPKAPKAKAPKVKAAKVKKAKEANAVEVEAFPAEAVDAGAAAPTPSAPKRGVLGRFSRSR